MADTKQKKAPKPERRRYTFAYEFADGTVDSIEAHTPGDARALMKAKRGGSLPKVKAKTRIWLNPPQEKPEPAEEAVQEEVTANE